MKKLIKLTMFLTLCLFLTGMMSCSDDKDNIISDSSKLEGKWTVVHYIVDGNTITKNDKPTWPDYNNGDITLELAPINGHHKGKVVGKSVTNSLTGDYTLGKNNTIAFSIFTTEITEPEWTDLFKTYKINRYEIKEEKLYLYYDTTSIVLEKN
ncbi:META domain-containing protein [Tenacibaculum agarivorans]|uniref:hypothetical protein n=1 Tax=Tenacibaculum agarivorans TaxID=1908389 RepID=UPI000A980DA3|nr:hypothetical protein [Tenacibaculum agarivorans]